MTQRRKQIYSLPPWFVTAGVCYAYMYHCTSHSWAYNQVTSSPFRDIQSVDGAAVGGQAGPRQWISGDSRSRRWSASCRSRAGRGRPCPARSAGAGTPHSRPRSRTPRYASGRQRPTVNGVAALGAMLKGGSTNQGGHQPTGAAPHSSGEGERVLWQ